MGAEQELNGQNRSLDEILNLHEDISPMDGGFIEFEMRAPMTKEDLAVIRDINPSYGRICGFDTAVPFISRGEHQNGTFINLNPDKVDKDKNPERYEAIMDFRDQIDLCGDVFEADNLREVSLYKQFGESVEIKMDGSDFGRQFSVNNLCTLEVKVKGDPEPYRYSFFADDSGKVLSDFSAHGDHEIPMNLYPGERIDVLDRTNGYSQGAYRGIGSAGDRELFLEHAAKGEERPLDDLISREKAFSKEIAPITEQCVDTFRNEYVKTKDLLTRVDLYRENQLAELAEYKEKVADTVRSINDCTLDIYRKEGRIHELEEKGSLTEEEKAEKQTLVEERQELIEKEEGMKEEYVQKMKDYLDTSERLEIPKTTKIRDVLREVKVTAQVKMEAAEQRLEVLDENHLEEYKDLASPFELRCKEDAVQFGLNAYENNFEKIELNPDIQSFMDKVDEKLEKLVEAYNEDKPDLEKVFVGEDKQLYTYSGLKLELGAAKGLGQVELLDRYKPDMDHEPETMETPVYIGEDNYLDATSVSLYSKDKATGSEMTRIDILKNTETDLIRRGNGEMPFEKNHDDWKIQKVTLETYNLDTKDSDALGRIDKYMQEHPEERNPSVINEESKKISDEDLKGTKIESKEEIKEEPPERVEVEESREKSYRRLSAGAYGKVDFEKSVAISEDKLKELEQEAKTEAAQLTDNPDDLIDKYKELLEEKKAELTSRLETIKEDITHYENAMNKFDHIPARYMNRYTPFQTAKYEYDSAIREYQDLGGKVGKESFVTSGVTSLEHFFDKMDFLHSNIIQSRAIDIASGMKTDLRQIYQETVIRDGEEVTVEHASYEKSVGTWTPLATAGASIGGMLTFLMKPIVNFEKFAEEQDSVEKQNRPDQENQMKEPEQHVETEQASVAMHEPDLTELKEEMDLSADQKDAVIAPEMELEEPVDREDLEKQPEDSVDRPDPQDDPEEIKEVEKEPSEKEIEVKDQEDVEFREDSKDVETADKDDQGIEREDQDIEKEDPEREQDVEQSESSIDQEDLEEDQLEEPSGKDGELLDSDEEDIRDFQSDPAADELEQPDLETSEEDSQQVPETDMGKIEEDDVKVDAAASMQKEQPPVQTPETDPEAWNIAREETLGEISESVERMIQEDISLDDVLVDVVGDACVNYDFGIDEIADAVIQGAKESSEDDFPIREMADFIYEASNALEIDGLQNPEMITDVFFERLEEAGISPDTMEEIGSQLDYLGFQDTQFEGNVYGELDGGYLIGESGMFDTFNENDVTDEHLNDVEVSADQGLEDLFERAGQSYDPTETIEVPEEILKLHESVPDIETPWQDDLDMIPEDTSEPLPEYPELHPEYDDMLNQVDNPWQNDQDMFPENTMEPLVEYPEYDDSLNQIDNQWDNPWDNQNFNPEPDYYPDTNQFDRNNDFRVQPDYRNVDDSDTDRFDISDED